MKKEIQTIIDRWKAESPKLFKRMTRTTLAISGAAVAIHVAVIASGATEPEWWCSAYPYIVGIPAGMAFVSKLTRKQQEGEENGKID